MSSEAADATKPSGKQQKKEDKKQKKGGATEVDYRTLPLEAVKLFLGSDEDLNLKVALVAAYLKVECVPIRSAALPSFPSKPAVLQNDKQIFGANNVARYFNSNSSFNPQVEDLINFEEYTLRSSLAQGNTEAIKSNLSLLEASPVLAESAFLQVLYYSSLKKASDILKAGFAAEFSKLNGYLTAHSALEQSAKTLLGNTAKASKSTSESDSPVVSVPLPPVVKGTIPANTDWKAMGLISSLKLLFDAAIAAAFPEAAALNMQKSIITRCANPKNGDFQCNNAMSLSKAIKENKDVLGMYAGLTQPKLVAERILSALPENNPVTSAVSVAPNGFINITLSPTLLVDVITTIVNRGLLPPPMPKQKVLVDFSSPNIAKEMHVGHLRSTIIGDAVCRILEFVGMDVLRVNHVGDWGTQFGMLITYLLAEYPDFLSNPPDISDLTKIYKESKRRFDADEHFKETSRLNVVRLQSGDATCRTIWQALCDISRKEFQKVYDMLDIRLTEVGESFYNPIIPSVIEELRGLGLVTQDAGMDIVRLPHFTIPLIVRKSDGGYGYDSTDMAALKHRLFTLKRDWIIVITDAGQASHFHMCFDAARAAQWVTHQRLDHIGFGVVCGDDGKRFKTRSSDTVRLIDLLTAAKDRMRESLLARQAQQLEFAEAAAAAAAATNDTSTMNNNDNNTTTSNNNSALAAKKMKAVVPVEEIESAAQKIGYGAVKYFDLKQHPETNYIFSYDNMLNTKGDTAVYLLFAYARVASILRKAEEEKNIVLASFAPQAAELLQLSTPEERALAFELLQFGDVIGTVLQELLPNRLCDYIKELSVKFTEFVTKCQVLNNDKVEVTHSRLLLCEATRRTMSQCFALLGIEPCERI